MVGVCNSLLTAETHSSEDTVWSHLSTTVSDNMSASWTRCTAHRINLFSCDSLLFSQRCCQFLLFRRSRGWPGSQNNVLIMFYKSYKYEFQECKWMIYIYKKTDSRRTKCGTQALNCPEVWQ